MDHLEFSSGPRRDARVCAMQNACQRLGRLPDLSCVGEWFLRHQQRLALATKLRALTELITADKPLWLHHRYSAGESWVRTACGVYSTDSGRGRKVLRAG